MKKNNVTRGYGLLEGYLAKKRAETANRLILDKYRCGRILDIGSGSGVFANSIYQMGWKNIEGVDNYRGGWFREPETLPKDFPIHDADASNLYDIADKEYDAVLLVSVIEHVPSNAIFNGNKTLKTPAQFQSFYQ